MTPEAQIRQAIMQQLTAAERILLGDFLTERRAKDRELTRLGEQPLPEGTALRERVRELGIDVVAAQEQVSEGAIYARLSRSGAHLRGRRENSLYKRGHEPSPSPQQPADATHATTA